MRLLSASSAAVLGLGGYAIAEPLMPVNVKRYQLNPSGWPAGLKLRIGVISDIHACEPWMPAARIASICAQTNGLGADVILLLGDYVSEMRFVTRDVPPREWAAALAMLKAPLGVHAVLGNHDWWSDVSAQANDGSRPAARLALEAAGIAVYSNCAVRLQKRGQAFWLAGLEDQLALLPKGRHWRSSVGKDDLAGTLRQVSDDAPVILMAHEPDIFPHVPPRVALTLSGHTHGGQVRIFGRAPAVPSRYHERYAYGHVREEGRDIIISGGLGCSMLPIRFAAPPEINLIEVG